MIAPDHAADYADAPAAPFPAGPPGAADIAAKGSICG
jgi:hypothetical protein